MDNEDALYQAMVKNGEDYHASEHYRRECMIPDPPSCSPEAKAAGHYLVYCLECGWVGCTDKTTEVNEDDPMHDTFSYRCPQCDSGELEDSED